MSKRQYIKLPSLSMNSTKKNKPKRLYFKELKEFFTKGVQRLIVSIYITHMELYFRKNPYTETLGYEDVEKVQIYSYNPKNPVVYSTLKPSEQELIPNIAKIIKILKDKIMDKKVFKYVYVSSILIKFDEDVPYCALSNDLNYGNEIIYDIAQSLFKLKVVKSSVLQTYSVAYSILLLMFNNDLKGEDLDRKRKLLYAYKDKILNDNDELIYTSIPIINSIVETFKSYTRNPDMFMKRPDIFFLFHGDEKRYAMEGTGTQITYLKDIAFPYNTPKVIVYPSSLVKFANSYPHFSLTLVGDDFDEYETDSNDIKFYFEWTSDLAFTSLRYDLLTGKTNSTDKEINDMLPRMTKYLIEKVFLTGNYIYLTSEINKVRRVESFTIKCQNGKYLRKPSLNFPHSLIDLLSTIYSKGNQSKQTYSYISLIFMIVGLYHNAKDNMTTVKEYVDDFGYFTNGDERAKLYKKKHLRNE